MIKRFFTTACLSATSMVMMAAGDSKINKGLEKATDEVKGIFNTACDLLCAVCAIMAIIGAFHVYSKWTSGDPDTTKAAAGWGGGLVFVGVAIAVIKAVFISSAS